MFSRRPKKAWVDFAVTIGHISFIAFVAASATLWQLKPRIEAAYSEGLKQGKASQDWKAELAKDQNLANKVCTTWWFTMNHTERSLNVPERKKK